MAVTLVLVAAVIAAFWFLISPTRGSREAPGPFRWPIIGNLPQLRAPIPFQALTDLAKKYGSVYSLQLGSVPAVVVSGLDNIRQVLFHKANHFDSRPAFNRYHQLFDGDKENSLAFCDWSEVQRKRRELLNDHTFPKVYTTNFKELSTIISEEVEDLVKGVTNSKPAVDNQVKAIDCSEEETNLPNKIKKLLGNKHISTFVHMPKIDEVPEEESTQSDSPVNIKEKLLQSTAKIFLRYFCSIKTEETEDFVGFVKDFDKIFYEINQGYASDFLPFLDNFVKNNIEEIKKCSRSVRKFVETNIIKDRLEKINKAEEDKDYVESLLRNVKFGADVRLSLDAALFSLEDILGGHSAIGNFIVKLLTFIVDNETVQNKIVNEAKQVNKDFVTLDDRDKMPYTESVIMEALRLVASPIVPHVANQDTQISGYSVKKGTLIMLNNYDLNMSPELWDSPEKFEPSRFLEPDTGKRAKPVHFMPFGGGRRSCMGYKLVQLVTFSIVSNLVMCYKIKGISGEDYSKVPIGNLALPENTFKFAFEAR